MSGPDRPEQGWAFPEVTPYDEAATDDTTAISSAELFADDEPVAASAPAEPTFHVPRRVTDPTEPISPMRALAGAAVAVAGVLLGLGALLWATEAPGGSPTVTAGQNQTLPVQPSATLPPTPAETSTPAPTPQATPPVVQASPSAPEAAPKLAVTVLNNSRITGLADRAARRFRAGGWPIRETGNFTGKVTATTVYYAPGQLASAQRLQQSFSGLVRVRPRFATLPGTGLTVVLTRDYRP